MMGLAGKLVRGTHISYVSSASVASADTLTLPTYSAGDTLFMFAYTGSSTTSPTVPSGWTTIQPASNTPSNQAGVIAYRVATGTDPVGTWTGATNLVVMIYRGVKVVLSGTSYTIDYEVSQNFALWMRATSRNGSTSWYIGFVGTTGTTGLDLNQAPTGMVNRTTTVGAANSCAGNDTNYGASKYPGGNPSGYSITLNQIVNSLTYTLEVMSS